MSYVAAVDHLYARGLELAPDPTAPVGTRRKFDLEHMRILSRALGDPQKNFPSVLIAGTNGKGSTAATLASILTTAGYRTALYTSPHLSRVNERIQISGESISDEDFARLYFQVDSAAEHLVAAGELPQPPSFFETLTGLAFLHFSGDAYTGSAPVDIAVLEVGLGGRLDATNIVDPLISILTDISLDHQDYLGDTITEITREKTGILRPQGTLVTLPQHPEANQAIGEAAAMLDLHAISAANYIPTAEKLLHPEPGTTGTAPGVNLPRNRYTISVDGQALHVDSPLMGQHQQRNIALAVAAAEELRNCKGYNRDKSNSKSYEIPNAAIEDGIRKTLWPGRLELVSLSGSAPLLMDVAHNPAGAWTLRAVLAQLPEETPRTLLFSCLRDKDLREMSQILLPLFDRSSPDRPKDHIFLAPINSPRAASLEELSEAAEALEIPVEVSPTLAEALAQARAVTPLDGLILATGSVYLIGELRPLALNLSTEEETRRA
ncbi:bifunctional folylpolyglutamate synthase/dihydrofolate synthase [Edaphobacter modestus]|uniref:Dihydrofolate synthase/folylpolyglutamate synthase n=1 Tax=Edaphobacter modestus TaxID=388466 RepID=A0A4Q7YVK9_9BACT|nr:folylpolyglutamate synthase/dihydrofolate synthase family protein [Edaphobacter modestus]RZU41710.1 dihydrofolate synthase/folylpolyglutamate synthase [Edaphobacter modestus]